MTDKTQEDILFEEAFDLIIRMQSEPGNPVVHNLIARWRARGANYEAIWREALDVHGIAGKVMHVPPAKQRTHPLLSRRAFMIGGGTAIATVATTAGALTAPQLLLYAKADYSTSTAQTRDITLADGINVTLGPRSAINVNVTDNACHVDLLEGLAYFDIASRMTNVFKASMDSMQVTTTSAGFEMRRDNQGINVAVGRGEVRVSRHGVTSDEMLAEGKWLRIANNLAIERGTSQINQMAAWRSGMLIARQESLTSVVAQIARWQSGRVILANTAISQQEISGIFNLNKPREALQAVVQPYGGKVAAYSRWITIITAA